MVLSVFAARLVQLQGVDPDQYAEMAAAEGSVDVILPATRGEILDRNGEPLAESIDGRMIVADPTLTADDAPELATFLAKRLEHRLLPRARAAPGGGQPVPVHRPPGARRQGGRRGRRAPRRRASSASSCSATRCGSTRPATSRPTSSASSAPRSSDGSARALAGLEDSFDDYLSGVDGEARYEMGAGAQIPLGDNTVSPAVDGSDLNLTLDADLQFYTQRVLQQTVEGSHAESGIAVIMDSRTGEILALADYPTYDASEPQEWPKSRYKSSALTDVYEPGSTEKVLTLSAVIDAGLGRPRQQYVVPRRPQPAGPADPRPLGARHRAPHPGRHPRQVVQHRHRARRRPVRARRAAVLPDRVRLRRARPAIGLLGETKGMLPAGRGVDRPGRRPDRVRAVALDQRDPDDRGGQHDRQRRRPHRPEPGRGQRHPRRRHRGRHRPGRASAG